MYDCTVHLVQYTDQRLTTVNRERSIGVSWTRGGGGNLFTNRRNVSFSRKNLPKGVSVLHIQTFPGTWYFNLYNIPIIYVKIPVEQVYRLLSVNSDYKYKHWLLWSPCSDMMLQDRHLQSHCRISIGHTKTIWQQWQDSTHSKRFTKLHCISSR